MAVGGGRRGGGGIVQKGKGTHAHGQQYGDCWGVGGIRILNGNGNNITKIKLKLKLKTKKRKGRN